MNYHDIPEYSEIEMWKNANNDWEVKFLDSMGEIVLHLVEDQNANDSQIEDETFYLDVENDHASIVRWIRERKGIEMPGGMDADYVTLRKNGTKNETQHNHIHLDRNVDLGKTVPLTLA